MNSLKLISRIFSPRGIAIIGVNENTKNLGTTIYTNILSSNYQGKIFPIHKKLEKILGNKCYKSIKSIPYRVDLVIISNLKEYSKNIINDIDEKHIKTIIITDKIFNKEQINKFIDLAKKKEIIILGPNSAGVHSPKNQINASYFPQFNLQGDHSFVTDSNLLYSTFLDLCKKNQIGLTYSCALGKKKLITELQIIEYYKKNKNIKTILVLSKNELTVKDIEVINKNNDKLIIMNNPKNNIYYKYLLERKKCLVLEDINSYPEIIKLIDNQKILKIKKAQKIGVVSNTNIFNIQSKKLNLSQHIINNKIDSSAFINKIQDICKNNYDLLFLKLFIPNNININKTLNQILNIEKQINTPILLILYGGENTSLLKEKLLEKGIYTYYSINATLNYIKKILNIFQKSKEHINIKTITEKKDPKIIKLLKSNKILKHKSTKTILKEKQINHINEYIVHKWEDIDKIVNFIKFPVKIKATKYDTYNINNKFTHSYYVQNIKELKEKISKLQEKIYSYSKHEHAPILIQELYNLTNRVRLLFSKKEKSTLCQLSKLSIHNFSIKKNNIVLPTNNIILKEKFNINKTLINYFEILQSLILSYEEIEKIEIDFIKPINKDYLCQESMITSNIGKSS